MKETINFTIPIQPRTKKNSQRIVLVKGRPIIMPSKLYKEYEKECGKYLPHLDNPIDYPINLKCIYYMPTKRRVDLCNLEEAISDILTKYKIINDDNRNIIASYDGSVVLYDKSNPRTEIYINKKENYEKW